MHCVGAGKFCVWPLLRMLGGVKLTKYCLFQRCLNFESIKCPRGRNEEKKPIHYLFLQIGIQINSKRHFGKKWGLVLSN